MPHPLAGVRSVPARSAAVRAFVVLAALLLMVLTDAPAARAHDALAGSTPADGATLDQPPAEVVLTYSAELLDAAQTVLVADAGGVTVAQGSPTVSGRTAVLALPTLAAGQYTVSWSVVSSDGHRIEGRFAFTVAGGPPAEPTPTPAVPQAEGDQAVEPAAGAVPASGATTPPPSPGEDDAAAVPAVVPGWLALLLALGAFGGIVAVAVRRWRSSR